MQVNVHHTDIAVATIPVSIGTAKLLETAHEHFTSAYSFIEALVPYLTVISYLVGIAAGIITIYYKIKNKQ